MNLNDWKMPDRLPSSGTIFGSLSDWKFPARYVSVLPQPWWKRLYWQIRLWILSFRHRRP